MTSSKGSGLKTFRELGCGAWAGLRIRFWSILVAVAHGLRAAGLVRALVVAGLVWELGAAGLACKPQSQPVVGAAKTELALQPPPAPASRPIFLWRAELGGSTFHLLGSVHVARADLYPLDPRIEAAFAESDALVLELALDEAAQLGAAQRMFELGQLEPGVRLADVVQPATWELLVKTQERRGGSLFGLRGFRPWFVALALTTQALESEGFSAEHGIDEHFRRGAEGRMRIIALETVEEQLQLFTGLSADEQEHLLLQTLVDIDQFGEQLDTAFRAWSAGDAGGLEQLLLGPMREEYPALFAELFTLRNRKMLTRLAEMAKQPGRYFVVVGAGHLVGRDGIVDLLRSQGIVPKQL